MIFTGILNLAYAALTGIVSLLPVSTGLPAGISDAFLYIINAINSMSFIIPVGALFTALGIMVAFEFGLWTFFGLLWVWRRLPFVGR